MAHPCLSCGACCAAYRVSFHWLEASAADIPPQLLERVDPHRLAMRGTWARAPHCQALRGAVGADVACTIYAQRPSPCRELAAAWEHGVPSPQCDRARRVHGLAPLTPADWVRG
jgi:Fe-S-cluster containining protein